MDTRNRRRDDTIVVYAAGSLRDAIGDLAWTFASATNSLVRMAYGYSGVLRARIEAGEKVDLFASADQRHPARLLALGLATRVATFARNALSLVALPRLGLTAENLLDRLLDGDLVLGVFPPVDDPLGDYTRAVFHRAERLRPGSLRALEQKARIIERPAIGGSTTAGSAVVESLLERGAIDLHICYRSTARKRLQPALPGLIVVDLPSTLQVRAHYAFALLRHAHEATAAFGDFILSAEGQSRLAHHGFVPVRRPIRQPAGVIP